MKYSSNSHSGLGRVAAIAALVGVAIGAVALVVVYAVVGTPQDGGSVSPDPSSTTSTVITLPQPTPPPEGESLGPDDVTDPAQREQMDGIVACMNEYLTAAAVEQPTADPTAVVAEAQQICAAALAVGGDGSGG